MAIKLKAIVYSARSDKDGEWKLTLSIPQSDAIKAAGLATQVETVFDVTFEPEEGGQ